MRYKSKVVSGFQVFAVAGINTVSFAIKSTAKAKKGLLGFAVERADPAAGERYFIYGFKVFPSVVPHPTAETSVSTFDHPVQSFVWDDFTAKPDRTYEYFFYPLKGSPKNLDRSTPPVSIRIHTEPLFSQLTHDVFFNRGVASSQAYVRRFQNKKPSELPPDKAAEAREWLSRQLDDALLRFIAGAKKGDGLLGCFYEFRYPPAAEALKAAIDRGAEVSIIVDAKDNGFTDAKGVHASFPREDNFKTIQAAKIPAANVILREAKPGDIQHNKFMVLLKGKTRRPAEVWTGSTNLSDGGIHGQTNVGHWVRDEGVATAFQAYWQLLSGDPGAQTGDDKATARAKNDSLKKDVKELVDVPTTIDAIPQGVTCVFSPRAGLTVLDLYVKLVESASVSAAVTLAFGINKAFKNELKDHTAMSSLVFMLLEKEDRPSKTSQTPFIAINASNNVYKAWGSYIDDAVYQWAKETNARALELNSHVAYVHSKFLLSDPLGTDPVVVTGSANFSESSTNSNDENMLIIRGDKRVADIYFTEFNRLFNHYYFRAVHQATKRMKAADTSAEGSLFLDETGEWQKKYAPGKLRQKRVDLFTEMKGFSPAPG